LSECDLETSPMRRSGPTGAVEPFYVYTYIVYMYLHAEAHSRPVYVGVSTHQKFHSQLLTFGTMFTKSCECEGK
jgi:hypothetical protein